MVDQNELVKFLDDAIKKDSLVGRVARGEPMGEQKMTAGFKRVTVQFTDPSHVGRAMSLADWPATYDAVQAEYRRRSAAPMALNKLGEVFKMRVDPPVMTF